MKTQVSKECSLFDKLVIERNEFLIMALALHLVTSGAETPINSLPPHFIQWAFSTPNSGFFYKSSRGIILCILCVLLVFTVNYILTIYLQCLKLCEVISGFFSNIHTFSNKKPTCIPQVWVSLCILCILPLCVKMCIHPPSNDGLK